MDSRGRYRRVLRRPGIRPALLPYVLARVASAMVLLALLLHVQRAHDSFLAAGLVTGLFAAAVAVASPALGRLVDRRGQTPVLVLCGLLHPVALTAVALGTAEPVVLVAGTVLAGATVPPMAACMRALWPALVDDEDLRPTAFAIESLVVEACELGGPLLVGALVALVHPGAALGVAAGLSATGTLLFAASRASRSGAADRRSGADRRSVARRRGPLSVPGVRRAILVVGVTVAAVSALEVSIAAFAAGRGTPAAAGWLIGAWVAGSLAAGWCYGARSWRAPLPLQLCGLLLAGAVAGLAPLAAAGPWSMAALLVVAGLCLAPSTAVQFAVLSELAPDRRRTESFTWASTAAFLGVATGNLLTGPAVEAGSWRSGVLLASSLGLLAAGLSWSGRYALGLPRPQVWTVPVELYDEALAELDAALLAARAAGARSDELARELARVRLAGRVHPVDDPVAAAELEVQDASWRTEEIVTAGLLRLDAARGDLQSLEQRRAAVLADLERLRASLLAAELPVATVTSLPRQPSGAEAG